METQVIKVITRRLITAAVFSIDNKYQRVTVTHILWMDDALISGHNYELTPENIDDKFVFVISVSFSYNLTTTNVYFPTVH